jgi:hypothetical protein
MSRVDRMIVRRQGASRPKRPIYRNKGPGRREVYKLSGEIQYTSGVHGTGDTWWGEKLADLVDRRKPDGTYEPVKRAAPKLVRTPTKPPMAARPPGMTRQVQRSIYRRMCKDAGVPWRE